MSQPPRKRLRKGTRSCVECRKRKVRCTLDSGNGSKTSCDGCVDRHVACIGQEDAPDLDQSHETLRDRLRRLEATVESLNSTVVWLRNLEEARSSPVTMMSTAPSTNHPSTIDSGIGNTFETGEGIRDDHVEHDDGNQSDEDDLNMPATEPAYLKSLFNNHVLSSATEALAEIASSTTSNGRPIEEDGARTQLLALVPCREDVSAVVESATDWMRMYNSLRTPLSISSKENLAFRHGQLHSASTNTASIAMWLVCFSISLLQLPQGFNSAPSVSINHPSAYVQRTVKEVDKFFCSDSAFRNIEAIECATMFAKLASNLGRPKKGWLVLRRTISFAQLLDLHGSRRELKQLRTQQYAPPERIAELENRAALWEALVGVDRFLSLLLNLPAGTTNMITSTTMEFQADNPKTRLQRMMCTFNDIADRLCHRDQLDSETDAFKVTETLIHDLAVSEQMQPTEWWGLDRPAAHDMDATTSVLLQMSHRYFTIRTHLPYLLKAKDDARYQPNAMACMQACRDLLKRFDVFRTSPAAGIFRSRIGDLQVFVACVILLLHRDRLSWYLPQTDSWQTDSAILENAKAEIANVSDSSSGSYTRKMISTLNKIQRCLDGAADSPNVVQLRVPLLGTISVRRSNFDHEPSVEYGAVDAEAAQFLPETQDALVEEQTPWKFPFDVDLLDVDWLYEELSF